MGAGAFGHVQSVAQLAVRQLWELEVVGSSPATLKIEIKLVLSWLREKARRMLNTCESMKGFLHGVRVRNRPVGGTIHGESMKRQDNQWLIMRRCSTHWRRVLGTPTWVPSMPSGLERVIRHTGTAKGPDSNRGSSGESWAMCNIA